MMTDQSLPEHLTRRFLIKNREYEIGSPFHQWRALPWTQVVLMEVAGPWEAADCSYYLKEIWDIIDDRRRLYATVYLLIDARNMALDKEEFQQSLLESWGHLLDRGDVFVCPIEENPAKRDVWSAINQVVGTRNTIRVFPDEESAFTWLTERLREGESGGTADSKAQERSLTLPACLTLRWLEDHAHHRLIGANNKWAITAWNSVVYLKIRENWTPEEGDVYVEHLSAIPGMLGGIWDRVFLVFDISHMAFKPEDLHLYLRSRWLAVLDQERTTVCLVEAKKMRRLLLHSMYNLLGKRSRVKILASPDEALEWVQGQLAGAGAAGREEERAGAPPGELEAVVTNRIGEFLVRIGEMTAAEVEQVLDVQKGGDKRRFGDIAIELGFVRGGAIRSYVEFLEDRVDKNDSRS